MVKKLLLASCLILLFSFYLISAELTVGDTNENNNIIELITDIPLNVTTGSLVFNMSDIWFTDEGLMDNVPDLYPTLDLRYLELDGSNFGFDTPYLSYSDPNFDFNEVKLNATILDLTSSTFYNASVIETEEGTLDDGDLESIKVPEDGNSYNVSEDAGADPLIININFTNVEDFDSVIGRIWYEGGQGHTVQIEIYRVDTGEWENYEEYTDTTDFVNIHIPVYDATDHIYAGGNVSLRFDHANIGNPSHIFRIDFLQLVDGFTSLTSADHDGLSGRNNILVNHPNAVDVFLNLSGGNANQDIDIGSNDFTTTGGGRFDGGIAVGTDPGARLIRVCGSSNLAIGIDIDNAGAGDDVIRFALNEVPQFALGVDNTDDKFKISEGISLGSGDLLTMDLFGNTVISGNITGGTYNTLSIIPVTNWIHLSTDGAQFGGFDIAIPTGSGDDFWYGYGGTESHFFGGAGELEIDSDGNLTTSGYFVGDVKVTDDIIAGDDFSVLGNVISNLDATGYNITADWGFFNVLNSSSATIHGTLNVTKTGYFKNITSNIGTNLSINPSANNDVNFFENAVSGENPKLNFFGWSTTAGKLIDGHIVMDSSGRMVFGGDDVNSILFNRRMAISSNYYIEFGRGEMGAQKAGIDETYIGLQKYTDSRSPVLHIINQDHRAYDFGFPQQNNPTVLIHSMNAVTDEWMSLTHNNQTAYIGSGKGGITLANKTTILDDLNVTGNQTFGSNVNPTNITMYDSAGTSYVCGVNLAGVFNCG